MTYNVFSGTLNPTHLLTFDNIVLDFPVFPALGNGGAESVDFGSANRRKLGFFVTQICQGAHMNTPIGDKLFQDIPRCVAKFCKNRPRDVEKSDGEFFFKNNTTKI